jgi:hypothetical protein
MLAKGARRLVAILPKRPWGDGGMYTAAAIHMNRAESELRSELDICGWREGGVCPRRDRRVLAVPTLRTEPCWCVWWW